MTEGPATATIRRARLDDLERVLAVQQAAEMAALGHVFPPDRYPFPVTEMRDRWRGALDTSGVRVLLAAHGARAVGVACTAPGWLQGLFVVPDAWGSGLADRLHDEAIGALRAAGESCCRLWVIEANQRARRFYARHGWRQDGQRQSTPFPPYPVEVSYTLTW
jgi:GNAT superfamily N-acetyltransferase